MKWWRYAIVTGGLFTSLCWLAKYNGSKNAQIAILKHEIENVRDPDEETTKEEEVHIMITERENNTTHSYSSMPSKESSLTATEKQSEKSWITEAGIIVPFLTVAAYLFALSHEGAMCEYFHIPHNFISLSPTVVLTTLLGNDTLFLFIILSLAFLIGTSRGIGNLCSRKEKTGLLIAAAFWFAFSIFTLALNQDTQSFSILSLTNNEIRVGDIIIELSKIALIAGGIEIIIRKSTFSERVIFIGLLIGLVTGTYLYRAIGTYGAHNQVRTDDSMLHKFPIVALSAEGSMPRLKGVVLRSYGEYLFAAPINCDTKEVEKKLVIVKISETPKPSLTVPMEKASFILPMEKANRFCGMP